MHLRLITLGLLPCYSMQRTARIRRVYQLLQRSNSWFNVASSSTVSFSCATVIIKTEIQVLILYLLEVEKWARLLVH